MRIKELLKFLDVAKVVYLAVWLGEKIRLQNRLHTNKKGASKRFQKLKGKTQLCPRWGLGATFQQIEDKIKKLNHFWSLICQTAFMKPDDFCCENALHRQYSTFHILTQEFLHRATYTCINIELFCFLSINHGVVHASLLNHYLIYLINW